MKKAVAQVECILLDIAANLMIYLATLAGVLATKFLPPLIELFRSGQAPQFGNLVIWQLVVGAVIALGVVCFHEQQGMHTADENKKAQVAAGRAARWKKRIVTAFVNGCGWFGLVGGAFAAATGIQS